MTLTPEQLSKAYDMREEPLKSGQMCLDYWNWYFSLDSGDQALINMYIDARKAFCQY